MLVSSRDMYVKTTTRRNKDGTPVRYLHLAHNQWDQAAGRSVPKILYGFGREDQLDRAAIKRLVAALSGLLEPADALAATVGAGLGFVESRPLGGAYVLDGLWHRLGIDKVMANLLKGRRLDRRTERVLFGLVANRALAPSSKLAAAAWITHDVHIDGLPASSDDACYRAMDWLHDVTSALEREVFWQLASLLDLEVDLLFFDTTSTYFELDEPDEPVARDERGQVLPKTENGDGDGEELAGFGSYGKSKDHRDDLPQIVIGMAVTRAGIPVRVWCWPGNTTDSALLIRQVKQDLRDWTLARVIWVADRGFASAQTAATCGVATTTTSSGSGCAPARPKRPPPCNAKAATSRLPATCGSRRCGSARPSGSSSATTPGRRPRPGDPHAAARPARRGDRRRRQALGDQAGRAARGHLHQARPAPLPAHHPRRAAPRRQARQQDRDRPGRQVPAALL